MGIIFLDPLPRNCSVEDDKKLNVLKRKLYMPNKKKKILLVDDEQDLLKVLTFRLEGSGYDVVTAVDGQEALNVALATVPDILILDVYLPFMNGDEVVKQLKKDERLKNVPAILISATAVSLGKKAFDCGANAYFTKPFDPKDLLAKIEKLLA